MLRPFLSYVSCPEAYQPDVELIVSGKQASSVSNYIYTYLCLKKEKKKEKLASLNPSNFRKRRRNLEELQNSRQIKGRRSVSSKHNN